MCKKTFVSDLKRESSVGMEFKDVFFLKKIKKEDNGSVASYLVTLSDKTGEIIGRIWKENMNEVYLDYGEMVVVAVGKVTTYRGFNNLIITSLEKAEKYDTHDLIEVAPGIDELYNNFIEKYHADVKKPHLLKLLDSFYMNEACSKRFKRLQGAKQMHHVKVGGYLEHINTIYDISKTVANQYILHPFFDIEVLLTAAALHDVGKVYEYMPLPINKRTDIGVLLGHLALSVCMVYKAISDIPDFPEADKVKLLHCIYTSHGDQDKIIKPACIEALILHRVDEMDARVDGFNNIIATDFSKDNFTKYNKTYEQYIYKL